MKFVLVIIFICWFNHFSFGQKVQIANRNNTSLDTNAIFNLIKGFKEHNNVIVNQYVNKKEGVYLIPGPGTTLYYEKLDSINFNNSFLTYHSFGSKNIQSPYIQQIQEIPQYDCDLFQWNIYGLFLLKSKCQKLTNILLSQQRAGIAILKSEFKLAHRIDTSSSIIYLTEEKGDFIFGFIQTNGIIQLTYIDFSETYCDI